MIANLEYRSLVKWLDRLSDRDFQGEFGIEAKSVRINGQ